VTGAGISYPYLPVKKSPSHVEMISKKSPNGKMCEIKYNISIMSDLHDYDKT
jgi:hypothetical protein